jgi:hypothetical protein
MIANRVPAGGQQEQETAFENEIHEIRHMEDHRKWCR